MPSNKASFMEMRHELTRCTALFLMTQWDEKSRRGVAQPGLERLHGVQKVASSNLVAPS